MRSHDCVRLTAIVGLLASLTGCVDRTVGATMVAIEGDSVVARKSRPQPLIADGTVFENGLAVIVREGVLMRAGTEDHRWPTEGLCDRDLTGLSWRLTASSADQVFISNRHCAGVWKLSRAHGEWVPWPVGKEAARNVWDVHLKDHVLYLYEQDPAGPAYVVRIDQRSPERIDRVPLPEIRWPRWFPRIQTASSAAVAVVSSFPREIYTLSNAALASVQKVQGPADWQGDSIRVATAYDATAMANIARASPKLLFATPCERGWLALVATTPVDRDLIRSDDAGSWRDLTAPRGVWAVLDSEANGARILVAIWHADRDVAAVRSLDSLGVGCDDVGAQAGP